MSFAATFVKRPVLALVLSIVIVLFGMLGFKYLGIREFPSIDPPIITVRTSYTGASAEVIESQITEPLEKSINGISGIRNISSTSATGSSQITVEFDLSSDLEAAANDVRDKVSLAVRQLPQDIDAPPVVSKADANSDAILALTVQSVSKNHLQVNDYAENVLVERLQTIPGVSGIQVWGQKKYAMRLWIDPTKLAAYQLSISDIQNALDKENVDIPAGKLAGNTTELTVRTNGKLRNEADFNNLIIASSNNQTVRFSDVGYAVLGAENEETILKESGIPMIGLGLVPQPGANYVEIADEFYKRFEQLKKEVPEDFKIDIALDNTKFIKRSIKEVEETLLIAFVLVVLIIYLFFRDWLIAFRPLIDIPVSLIGSFFIMYLADFSINVLTLLGIVLATGLVVDDGIVVTENIYKKIEDGMDAEEAAIKGTDEILFAVISTSITLAVVFMPILFLEGFVGRLFREFGIVVAGSVLISAFVSLTLTPMLSVKLARKGNKRSKFYEKTEPYFEKLNENYGKALAGFLRKRWWAFIILAASLVFIFVIGKSLPSELAPLDDRGSLRVQVTGPEGVSYEYTTAYMDRMAQFIIDSVPEKKVLITVAAPGFTGSGAVNTGFARIAFTEAQERKRSQQEIAQYLGKKFSVLNDAKTFVIQEQTINGSGGSRAGLPVQYVLQAPNFAKLQEYVPKFMEEAQKSSVFQIVDVNLKFNRPELDVSIDREKARELGISVFEIARTLQLAYSGERFSYFTMNGKQYSVIGQVDRKDRDEPLDLKSLYVKNSAGQMIQMDNVLNVNETSMAPQIYHFNRYVSATISAGLAPGKTIGDGIKEMQRIGNKTLDKSFSTALNGPSRDFAESSSNTSFAFLLALVLIYLVLSAQFESFIDPLIIMVTVPMALAGALLALWYFDQTLNIFSQIGTIVLVGLVTKNGILIVEFANQLKEQGYKTMEAAQHAAVMRLRPIMMTSLATMLGALPIALALGAGSKSRVSMGIVIIGGLLFSGLLTLFVIPAVYTLFSKKPSHPQNHV